MSRSSLAWRPRAAAVRAVAAALLGSVLLVAVATAAAQPTQQSERTVNTITIGIAGIPPYWYGVRTYLAADKQFGFYRRAGVNVAVKGFATGQDALRAVVAGQIDAAWADTGFGITLISKRAPLVGIEGMDKVDYVIATRDSSIKRCADLRGTTIVVEAIGSSRYHALQSMLTACNLTVDDVEVVAMATGQLQAMLAGQVQSAVVHLNDLAQAASLGTPARVIVRIGQTDPDLSYDTLWVKRDNLAKKRADFLRVIKGDILASRYMYTKRNFEKVAKYSRVTGSDLKVARIALREFLNLEYWPLNRSGIGTKSINRTISENVRLGNIPRSAAPKYNQVVDVSLWNEVWKEMRPKKK